MFLPANYGFTSRTHWLTDGGPLGRSGSDPTSGCCQALSSACALWRTAQLTDDWRTGDAQADRSAALTSQRAVP